MRAQVDLATDVLAAAPTTGAAAGHGVPLRPAFEEVYAAAVAASQAGRSVSPARQILEAGARTGRAPEASTYLNGLASLVDRTPFTVASGAVEVVQRLREEGWATALVSNTVGEPGKALLPVLRRLGVESLIDAFVFSDEGPWTKPSPEIFREALERLGGAPERAVHVGDGWVDIEGARRANFRAGILYTGLQHYGKKYRQLFLPEGWSNPSTPYRFRDWSELPGLLAGLR